MPKINIIRRVSMRGRYGARLYSLASDQARRNDDIKAKALKCSILANILSRNRRNGMTT